MDDDPQLRAILFDLDGTLIDAFPVHFAAFRYLFSRFGIEMDEAKFLETYTPNWYKTFEMMHLPADQWDTANSYWMEEAARHDPTLFPGVIETLERLNARYRLGVVTSGTGSRVQREMEHTGIRRFFDVVISGDDVIRKKPDPQGLELALAGLSVTVDEAVYVGDALADWQMAQATGMRFIGIPSRFESLTSAMGCEQVGRIEELPEALE